MSIHTVALEMMTEAGTRYGKIANPCYWVMGPSAYEEVLRAGVSITNDSVEFDPTPVKRAAIDGDTTFCGMPAFVSKDEGCYLRLMMSTQVSARAVE